MTIFYKNRNSNIVMKTTLFEDKFSETDSDSDIKEYLQNSLYSKLFDIENLDTDMIILRKSDLEEVRYSKMLALGLLLNPLQDEYSIEDLFHQSINESGFNEDSLFSIKSRDSSYERSLIESLENIHSNRRIDLGSFLSLKKHKDVGYGKKRPYSDFKNKFKK